MVRQVAAAAEATQAVQTVVHRLFMGTLMAIDGILLVELIVLRSL